MVSITAGDIPSVKLQFNYGEFDLSDVAYDTPMNLENHGLLLVGNGATLTVNGALDNFAPTSATGEGIFVNTNGSIMVNGDFQNEPGAVLIDYGKIKVSGEAILDGFVHVITGEIRADGELTVNGILQVDGVLGAPLASFAEGSVVLSGSSPGKPTILGSAQFASTAALSLVIAGAQTNQFDILTVSSNALLNGTLAVTLLNGFRPAPGDTFPMIQAGSITGQFVNATNGQRIATVDGYGSFVVNYTPTGVVLNAFQANPNPPPTAPAAMAVPTFDFDGTIHVGLTGSPGSNYVFQTSTNLMNWISLETNNADFQGVLEFETAPSTDTVRFFRALGL